MSRLRDAFALMRAAFVLGFRYRMGREQRPSRVVDGVVVSDRPAGGE